MKTRKRFGKLLLLCCLSLLLTLSVNAADGAGVVRKATSTENNAVYWNIYGIPTAKFTAIPNGGYFIEKDTSFNNAFDRNPGSYWKSIFINDGTYTLDNVRNTNWHNYIDVSFVDSVELDRVLYCSANDADGKGYATTMKLYFDNNESGEFENSKTYTSSNSTALMCFELGGSFAVKRMRLEWCAVPTYHYWNATAGEIIFLQPEQPEIEGMFSDFTRTGLSEGYDQAKITSLRSSLTSNVNYESQFKPLLDRAQAILDGTVVFDANRYYSTEPDEKNGHALYQYGNRRSYTQNTLGISWFGINKQSVGIAGTEGRQITVYVDAPEGQPLPQINFTQYWGSWRGWQGLVSLQRGVNVLTVPSYCLGYCTYPAQQKGGGPFYISNPYFASQQSGVKLYIEGGNDFPVYRLGDDEQTFYNNLEVYKANFTSFGSTTSDFYYQDGVGFNVAELESDHMLVTVQATNTYTVLVGGRLSVRQSMINWDALMENLMEYSGIPATKDSQYAQYWNDCNEHLGINIRLGQPVGAAYGAYEQVGVFTDDWISGAIFCNGKEGWGMIHEIGHTMDMPAILISECSNNMFSKYYESYYFSDGSRGEFARDVAALGNDRNVTEGYFDTNRLNYLVWFHLESYSPGFWGKLCNLYRYDCADCSGLSATEKHVYLASRVLGIDLRYYYDRYSYRQATNDTAFSVETQSDTLRSLMQGRIDKGEIRTDIQPRFWYLDGKQYKLNVDGGVSTVYGGESSAPSIRSVEKTASGYSLLLSGAQSGGMGYEIREGNDVIGFTYGSSFVDTTDYSDTEKYGENYTPSYTVVAIDRTLSATPVSAAVSPPAQNEAVCRLLRGEESTEYASLAAAIEAAQPGDTVVLLQNHTETGIVINKNLTLKGDDSAASPLILSKGSSGILLKVNNATVTIDGSKLILDGNSFEQAGTLILCESGTVIANGLELRNNYIAYGSDSYGGALRTTGGRFTLTNCHIHHNKARYGGGIALSKAGGRTTLDGCTIEYNEASENGGGIICTGAIENMVSTTISHNKAASGGGGIYVYGGGIVYANNHNANSTVTNTAVSISENSARDGGGIWQDGTTKLWYTTIENNSATANGGGVYSNASGNWRRFWTYTGTVLRNNQAVHTGTQLYTKCANADAGPQLSDTRIEGACEAGKSLVHRESGTNGQAAFLSGTVVVTRHEMTQHPEHSATCTETGTAAYYSCSICNGLYSDEAGQTSTTEEALLLPALGHSFGDDYESDASGHWHCCTREDCTATTETEFHTPGTDAVCTVCGYDTHVHALTLIPALEADCTHGGHSAYYTCTCGQWFSDAEGQNLIENHESVNTAALGHSYSDAWSTGDNAGHRHECIRCGSYESVVDHVYDNDNDLTCNICGFVRPHTHALHHVEATAADCTTAGCTEHYECSVCHGWFSTDASDGKTDTIDVITDHSSLTIPALGHDLSGNWLSDKDGHWRKCTRCDFTETKGSHNASGEDCSCTVCGHEHVMALHYVAAAESTCQEHGHIAYYECLCGKKFSDARGFGELTSVELPLSGHEYGESWSGNGTHHWMECIHCGEKDRYAAHQVAEGQHQCSVCEAYTSHDLEPVVAAVSTCTVQGHDAYYVCRGCNAMFSDAEGEHPTTSEAVTLPLLPHSYGNWTQLEDGSGHCHVCSCGHEERENHSEDATHHCAVCQTALYSLHEARAADCTESGNIAYYECSYCGLLFTGEDGSGITDEAGVLLPALGHSYSGEWHSDVNGHWQECNRCHVGAEEDKEPHRDDGSGSCAVCGYRLQKTANPITLSSSADITIQYGESFVLPSATALYGEPLMRITKGGTSVDAVDGAGEYTIIWQVPESSDYAEGSSAALTLTVNKAQNAIILTDDSDITVDYASQLELPVAQATFGEVVRSITISDTPVEQITDAGTYTVKWSVPEHDNYHAAETEILVTVTVGAQEPSPITNVRHSLSLLENCRINQYCTIEREGCDSSYICANGGLLVWDESIDEANATYENCPAAGIFSGLKYASSVGKNDYTQQTDGIIPRNYAKSRYLRMYLRLRDGSYVYGPLVEYSVFIYCDEVQESSKMPQEMKTLAANMKTYGNSAIAYFQYKESRK